MKPLLLALAFWVAPFAAYAADAPGCKDPADLRRFERSELILCGERDFAPYLLPTGKLDAWNYTTQKPEFAAKLDLSGRLRQRIYRAPVGPSSSEVFENYRLELEAKGYTSLYQASGLAFGSDQGRYFENVSRIGGQLMAYSPQKSHVMAAVKETDGRKTHLLLYVVEYAGGYHPRIQIEPGRVLVQIDTLESGDLSERMQLVKADEISRALERDGKIAIYGILFDFNRADIKPDSRPALDEIGRYLRANSNRKLYVVGHTDSVGGFDSNLRLSVARATSVAQDLVQRYGIAPERLKPAGAGLMVPLASNADEAGRAKNRRVELVLQ